MRHRSACFLPVICTCFCQVGVAGGGLLLAFRTVLSFHRLLEVPFRLLCTRFASFSDVVFCIACHSLSMITDALLRLLISCCLSAQELVFRRAWLATGLA